MKDDGTGTPLSRRVPGSNRSGPSQAVRRDLTDTDVHRIQAAIDAEHAGSELPSQREPNTEPIPVVTVNGNPPATSDHAPRPRATRAPRVEEPLRVAKALQAADELRDAERPRAAQSRGMEPHGSEEPASAAGRLRPEEPVLRDDPLRAPEPVIAEESARATEVLRTPESARVTEVLGTPESARVTEVLRAPEPVIAEEPMIPEEPVHAPEPVRAPEPVIAEEPVRAPEPVRVPEPVMAAQPVVAPEPPRIPDQPRAAWPPAETPQGTIGWLWPEDSGAQGGHRQYRPQGRRGGGGNGPPGQWTASSGRWRYRTATLIAAGAVVLAAGGLVLGMSLRSTPSAAGPSKTGTSEPNVKTPKTTAPTTPPASSALPPAEVIRASSWVAKQVGPDALVACTPPICSSIKAAGFPVSREVRLGTNPQALLSANFVVVTPALRSALSATPALGADVAPVILAKFGSGSSRIVILPVYPKGALAYQAALRQDVQSRIRAGEQLLNSGRVSASPLARNELAAGEVDPRLLLVLRTLSSQHSIDIAGFTDSGPGASRGVPFRVLELAMADPASGLVGKAYTGWLASVLLHPNPAFPPFSRQPRVRHLRDGQQVARFEYTLSPVWLLGNQ